MSEQEVKISPETKEKISEFHKLFVASPQSITPEIRQFIGPVNDIAWKIAKDQQKTIAERNEAYDIIKMIHAILGRKFDDQWRPKGDGKGGSKSAFIASADQRKKNCDDFIKYLGDKWHSLNGFEQAQILACIWGAFKS